MLSPRYILLSRVFLYSSVIGILVSEFILDFFIMFWHICLVVLILYITFEVFNFCLCFLSL